MSLAFVRGTHRSPVNSPHKRPVTRKMFPFDDVVMIFANMQGSFVIKNFNNRNQFNREKICLQRLHHHCWLFPYKFGHVNDSLLLSAQKSWHRLIQGWAYRYYDKTFTSLCNYFFYKNTGVFSCYVIYLSLYSNNSCGILFVMVILTEELFAGYHLQNKRLTN